MSKEKLKIVVYYETGDSFGSEHTYEELIYGWTNPDIIKENIEAIEEHYEAYEKENNRWNYQQKLQSYKNKWWYVNPEGTVWEWVGKVSPVLKLKLDDGQVFEYCAPWCGYFETLGHADVTLESNNNIWP